jgi:hypothetical protein
MSSARCAHQVGGLAHDLVAIEGETLRQVAKALLGRGQRAVEVGLLGMRHGPITSSVAGLITGIVRPLAPLVQVPSIIRDTSL